MKHDHDVMSPALVRQCLKLKDSDDWSWREVAGHAGRPIYRVQKEVEAMRRDDRAKEADARRALELGTGVRQPKGETRPVQRNGVKLEDVRQGIELRKGGVSWQTISEELGYPRGKLTDRIKEMSGGRDPITEEGRAVMREVSLQTLEANRTRMGRAQGPTITAAMYADAIKLREAGLSWSSIAERVKAGKGDTLRHYVKRKHGGDPWQGKAHGNGGAGGRPRKREQRRSGPESEYKYDVETAGRLRGEGRTWKGVVEVLGIPDWKSAGVADAVRAHFQGDPFQINRALGNVDLSKIEAKHRPRKSPKPAAPPPPAPAPRATSQVISPRATPPPAAATELDGHVKLTAFGQVLFDGPLSAKDAVHLLGLIKDL